MQIKKDRSCLSKAVAVQSLTTSAALNQRKLAILWRDHQDIVLVEGASIHLDLVSSRLNRNAAKVAAQHKRSVVLFSFGGFRFRRLTCGKLERDAVGHNTDVLFNDFGGITLDNGVHRHRFETWLEFNRLECSRKIATRRRRRSWSWLERVKLKTYTR